MKTTKRTIEIVLDFQTGKKILSSDFFCQPEDKIFNLREELEIAIQNNKIKYICFFCKQKLKIRGGGQTKKIFHFAHLKDSEDCHIKTDNKYTKEEIQRIKYNGAKESILHFELKNLIANNLENNKKTNKGIEEIYVEKVVKNERISKEWKKPDILTIYKSLKVAFELQLSTTFLSVIVSRQEFYIKNQIFLVWIFDNFKIKDAERKFTQSDVFYSNNQNGFELDEIAKQKSSQMKDLVLHCYYKKPIIRKNKIEYEWNDEYVTLNDLIFDKKNFKIFYFDVKQEKIKLQNQLNEINNSHKTKLLHILNYDSNLITSDYYKMDKITELFKDGYKLKKADKKYIKLKYENSLKKLYISYKDDFMLIIWTVFLSKMKNKEQIERLLNLSINSTAFHLIAIKFGKVVNYKFDNLIRQLHFAMDNRKQYIKLFLTAIKCYSKEKLIKKLDKTGKFKNKMEKYLQNIPEQDTKNNDIFILLFKELFKTDNI